MLDSWLQDVRLGFRLLAKYPLYSTVAVLTLTLAIGANTAVFSLVNGVLLRPLPYPDADRLVHLSGGPIRGGKDQNGISLPDFNDYRKEIGSFQRMALFSFFPVQAILMGAGEPEQITVSRVSSGFFETMGVPPACGRGFLPEEETPGQDTVIVLSHGLWTRRFGADASIVGKGVTLDSTICTVVGVAPPGFEFPRGIEAWVPLGRGLNTRLMGLRDAKMYLAVGRLAPSASLNDAHTQLDTVGARLEQDYPGINQGYRVKAVPLLEQMIGDIRPTLWLLAAVVAFVLLIACANVANLMLARAAARRREIAVRVALGARRGRLLRQLLTESMVLASMGGILGMMFAWYALHMLRVLNLPGIPRLNELRVDWATLLFTVAASSLTGLLFGLAPALHSTGGALVEFLKEGSRGSSEGGGANRLRSLLVVAEISLALVLLAGAGLLLESFRRLLSVDAGFQPRGLVTMQVNLPPRKYRASPVRVQFAEQFIERVRNIPGVSSAGATWILPLGGVYSFVEFVVEGEPPPPTKPLAAYTGVTPGYLESMRIPLVKGRFFDSRDRVGIPNSVIISRPLAQQYFQGADPIGRRITLDFGFSWTAEIVGIAGGVRHGGLAEEPRREIYIANSQLPSTTLHLVIRSPLEPVALGAAVREQLRQMDPDLPVHRVRTMEQVISDSIAQPRFRSYLVAAFAATALLLASVGIYGVMAFSVSRRTHEIGIRTALGATPRHIRRMVLLQSFLLVAAGVVVGLALSLALGKGISSLLFGIGASNPVVLAGVSLVLLAVSMLAAWIPARRAARIDPLQALHYE